ncbi:hypothetical protein [Arenimonas sp.]|uniref:hypothetical protein n=1 Tax=Arenimonas sp. TaxID=1872635 RepID=UPI002E30FD2A|nr:hypothetical protein [Arenimonas sp.]HEX4854833.1 hypothetical protein [Arenimonas sp.]
MDDLLLESLCERRTLNIEADTNNTINTILPFDTKSEATWNAHCRTGESMGSGPVLHLNLLRAALSTGTFIEAISVARLLGTN